MEYRLVNIDSQIISDKCRNNKGDKASIDIALERIKHLMVETLKGIDIGKDYKFEVKFILHRPKWIILRDINEKNN